MTTLDLFYTDSSRIKYQPPTTIIKVIGIGNCGNNAITRMVEAEIQGVDFIAINTDLQKLSDCKAPIKMQIGKNDSGGNGVGGDPIRGRKAAEENIEDIRGMIAGAHMVIISTGMGGGTGTGASPLVAQIAKEEKCLTVGVVTMPWKSEHGKTKIAKKGIEEISPYMDSLIVIPNDRVSSLDISKTILSDMYGVIDQVLRHTVQAITDIITSHGEINTDFNDVKTVLENSGTAIVGIGECDETANWKEAFDNAIKNPMLEDCDITRAKKLLIYAVSSKNVLAGKFLEFNKPIENIYGKNANLDDKWTKFGHCYENRLDKKVVITVIGTGFKSTKHSERRGSLKPADKATKKASAKENAEEQTLFSLGKNIEVNFDRPAYEVWTPSGRLDKK
jgi:cell division protein FtsZ